MTASTAGHESNAALYRVLGLLDRVKKNGSGYEARCPGPRHRREDRHPSLSVGVGDDGRVLLKCHTGCSGEDILTALHLDWGDLFEKSAQGNPVRRFRLLNTSGRVVAEHVREDLPDNEKKIWWESAGKRGLNGTALADLPLYLAHTLVGRPNDPVVLCEGEKPAYALAELGVLAVGTVTGAETTPSDTTLKVLQNREVWLWPDNDVIGREHMARIALKIKPAPKWVRWPEAPEKGDAADWIALGGTPEQLPSLVVSPNEVQIGPRIWTAPELAAQRFDATRWAIPTLLPAGLTILAGRPKLGKSWLGLGWSIDIPRGGRVLGKLSVDVGEALYLALEDGPQRMQERIALMTGDLPVPAGLRIATEWPRMNEGGLELLEAELSTHPTTRLVVIDTFKRVRPKEKNTQRLYDLDYDAIAPVAALARQANVAVVVVFHTRKGESTDPLEMVSGTLGLSGAADCVMVLRRERGQADASLFVTGRDVEEQDLALRWEKEDVLAWTLLGNAEDFRLTRERQEILEILESMPGSKPADIADALGKNRGAVRYLLFAMVRDAVVRSRDGAYFPIEKSKVDASTNANSPNSNLKTVRGMTGALTENNSAVSTASTVSPVSGVRGQFCGDCHRIHAIGQCSKEELPFG